MLIGLLAIACSLPANSPSDPSHGDGDDGPDTRTEGSVDADQDGYDASVDCNDRDSSVHPGTKETCGNGQDDNCNGLGDGCSWSGETTLAGLEISGEPEELFGSTLAVCDANGDGQQDLVVGATGTNESAGAVHVFYGPLGEETAEARAWMILGTGPATTLGSAIDCRSDMTGDGTADLLIGEPDESRDSSGTMYVVSGGETGVTSIADAFVSAWTGAFEGDRFGYGVFALDADGDESDEVAVTSIGAHGQNTMYGMTYVVGSSPGTHTADTASTYVYGTGELFLRGAAGNAGDMNGDGIDELAVTAHHGIYLGDFVALYQQPLIGPLGVDDADVVIADHGSLVGGWTRLEHADLSGDGYDDFLLGNADDGGMDGAVLVFHGTVVDDGTSQDPDVELVGGEDSFTGKAIASPGDLDGDGRAELLIGAPGAGAVYLHHGGETGRLELEHHAQASWWRAEDASHAGAALGAEDLTGDAIGDFAIGAPDAGDENGGAVVLIPSFDL